jgi:hypothetical protein
MWARSLGRWTTGPFTVAEVGIEPTDSHQALERIAVFLKRRKNKPFLGLRLSTIAMNGQKSTVF